MILTALAAAQCHSQCISPISPSPPIQLGSPALSPFQCFAKLFSPPSVGIQAWAYVRQGPPCELADAAVYHKLFVSRRIG
jgi:hypothetical protein